MAHPTPPIILAAPNQNRTSTGRVGPDGSFEDAINSRSNFHPLPKNRFQSQQCFLVGGESLIRSTEDLSHAFAPPLRPAATDSVDLAFHENTLRNPKFIEKYDTQIAKPFMIF
jgi:hypothetical protein